MLNLIFQISLAASACGSEKQCNDMGSAAYKKADYAAAMAAFTRQIDFAEVTTPAEDDVNALNNAALAQWKQGQCLLAMQYLRVANSLNVESKATAFNRQMLAKACAPAILEKAIAGEYWQYAGAGEWNKITIAPNTEGGKGEYRVDASALYVTRAPLAQNPGAFNVGGLQALGSFGGSPKATHSHNVLLGRYANEDNVLCSLQINVLAKSQIEPILPSLSAHPECAIGGNNVSLGGRYYQVSKGKRGLEQPLNKLSPQGRGALIAPVKSAPKLAAMAGAYSAVKQEKASWVVFQPCDADNDGMVVDAINSTITLALGQSTTELLVTDIAPAQAGAFSLKVREVDGETRGTLSWKARPNGVVEVAVPALDISINYVEDARIGDYSTVRESGCKG
jgi:hypothetical protein